MKYYRVKAEYDNKPRYYEKADHTLKRDGILIGNELYTEKERAKIMNGAWMFDEVIISSRNTYHFSGARFQQIV